MVHRQICRRAMNGRIRFRFIGQNYARPLLTETVINASYAVELLSFGFITAPIFDGAMNGLKM